MWVELLLALLVEGFREFQEWWQTRVPWRIGATPSGQPANEEHVAVTARRRSSEVQDSIEAVLHRHARKHVGIAIGVCWQDATWTFARGRVGASRAEAPGADTIFEIGSITKVFTATVLADMKQEGLVALEDPAQDYLPEGIRLPVRGRPITLRDLATHTSGLPRLPKGLLWRSLRQRANPYAGFTTEQLEQAIGHARLPRAPGERLRYSNLGFGLLGYLLARRAGTSYEQLVRERICDPLGLADTGISIPAEALPRFADGHNRRGQPVPHWELSALAGAGALRSTVADMLPFLELQLQEPTTRIGRAARMTHERRAHRGRLAQCVGWVSLPLRGHAHPVLWHNGGTGGFRSFAGFVKETETAVVVLSNCSRSVDAIGFRILEAINQSESAGTRAPQA